MKNSSLFLITFFIFLFLLSNLSFAQEINFALQNGERLLKIYRLENKNYILSYHGHYIILRVFNNNQLLKIKTLFSQNQLIDVYFNEDVNNNLFIALIIKNNEGFNLKLLDENLNIFREEILTNNLNDEFIISKYLNSQNQLLTIFKNELSWHLILFNFDNYQKRENYLPIFKEESFIQLNSNLFFIAVVYKNLNNNQYKFYIFDKDLNLIDTRFLENKFQFFDLSLVGNLIYFCGKNNHHQLSLAIFNIHNRNIDYHPIENIIINNQLKCLYLSGDINDLVVVYNNNDHFKLKFLNSDLEINFDNLPIFDIKKLNIADENIFDGYIKIIGQNRSHTFFIKAQIYENNYYLKSFQRYFYVNDFFDYLTGQNFILLQNNNRGKIYSDY